MRVTIGSRPAAFGGRISPVNLLDLKTAPMGALPPILDAISMEPSGVA
jgi:hypothetical protein